MCIFYGIFYILTTAIPTDSFDGEHNSNVCTQLIVNCIAQCIYLMWLYWCLGTFASHNTSHTNGCKTYYHSSQRNGSGSKFHKTYRTSDVLLTLAPTVFLGHQHSLRWLSSFSSIYIYQWLRKTNGTSQTRSPAIKHGFSKWLCAPGRCAILYNSLCWDIPLATFTWKLNPSLAATTNFLWWFSWTWVNFRSKYSDMLKTACMYKVFTIMVTDIQTANRHHATPTPKGSRLYYQIV